MVSAARATGADVDDPTPLARRIANMGMPLYGAQPPTGYSMKGDAWVSSSALLNRMNFALALTGGRIGGVKVDTARLAGSPPPLVDPALALSTMEAKLLADDVSKQTHDSILAQIQAPAGSAAQPPGKDQQSKDQQSKDQQSKDQQDKTGPPRKPLEPARPPDAGTMAGLLLGSPEFQKR